jgi:hypothetical protein
VTFDQWRETDKDLVVPPTFARELKAPRSEQLAAEQRRAMAAARMRVLLLLLVAIGFVAGFFGTLYRWLSNG